MTLLLKKKIIFLGLILNIVLVLLLAWVWYKKAKNYSHIDDIESKEARILFHTEKIRTNINRIESITKGFVATGSEKYLETYNRTALSVGRELEYLTVLFERDEQLKKNSSRLEDLIEKKITQNNRFIEYRRKQGIEEKNIISVDEDIRGANAINQTINELQTLASSVYEVNKKDGEDFSKRLNLASGVLFVLLLLLLIVVYFIITYYLRKKDLSESLLNKGQRLLQSIIDNTTNPIFVKQINGQYLLVNRQFEFLFHSSKEQIQGKTDHQIFSKEIADVLRSSDLDVVKKEKEIKIEEKFPHNGEPHTYLMVKFPIRDEQNKIYAIGGIATDITERKQLEVQFKTGEEEIVALFNAAPEGIIVIDQDGIIVRWNRKSEEMFGWKENEVLGKPMHEMIIPSKYREAHLKGLKNFLKTGEGPNLNKTIELSALNRKNEEFDIELTVAAIEKEGKHLFIAFLRNITVKKQLEKEVEQSQAFLNSVIENIPDTIFVKDAKELRYVRLNTAAEKLLGILIKDMLGKDDYDFFPKEQADFFTSKDRDVLRIGGVLDIPEEIVDTKKGKRWLHTKKIAIKDEKGIPIYLLGISEDITEKKKLKDEKEQAEKSMHDNEQRMKLILENIGEGVIVADGNEKILLSNRMAEDILKISEDKGPFDWSDIYQIYYPDSRTVFPAQNLPLEKALRDQPVDDLELVLFDPELKTRMRVLVTGQPIKDEKNQIIAAVATIKDITRYKELERALRESQTKYRQLIGFKTGNKAEGS